MENNVKTINKQKQTIQKSVTSKDPNTSVKKEKTVLNAKQNETKATKTIVKKKPEIKQNDKLDIIKKEQSEIQKTREQIQKTKNEIELIGIFTKLEKNLIEVLQIIPKNIDDEGKESVIANIKAYKEKVELARKIFDEYENTAKLITELSDSKENDQESIDISKKVIESRDKQNKSKIDEKDLLRQVQAMEKQTKGLEKIEIETLGDQVIVTKKKSLTKEL